MTQHIELDFGDPVHEGFFDPVQEVLSGAAPQLPIKVLNSTTLRLTAGTGNDQASVTIGGKYRFRTTNIDAGLPGGLPNGSHPVFVTATLNDFGGPPADPDAATDYSFGLEIKQSGNTPATPLYRKIGEVEVTTSAITAYRQLVGGGRVDGDPVHAIADHASQIPLRATGVPSQTAKLIVAETSTGTDVFWVKADGSAEITGQLTVGSIQMTSSGTLLIGDVTLSRSAAGRAQISGALQTLGAVAFNGQVPAARPDYTVTNAITDRTFNANSTTIDELADVLGTLIADLIGVGLLQ